MIAAAARKKSHFEVIVHALLACIGQSLNY
jgi:hypothetical protein